MNIFIGVVVGLVVLMALVTLHEFGHFMMAKRNGVKVLEFGIGFPPKIIAWVRDEDTKKWRRLGKDEWKKPQKGLIFSLNWLPIGGFCQMDGESAADKRKGTFGAASFWAKTKILFGGVMMNWLVAIVVFTILAWVGMPVFLENQFTIEADTRAKPAVVKIAAVSEGSPAEQAGILAGDYIYGTTEDGFNNISEVTSYNEEHAGETVVYLIGRDGGSCDKIVESDENGVECRLDEETGRVVFPVQVTLNSADSEYLLGISMETKQALRYSTWSAPITGVGLTLQITGETFRGMGEMVGKLVVGTFSQFSLDGEVRESGREAISAVGDSVSGPVGIIGVLFPAFTESGPANLAFLAALISISLACMNVLPIPALDGGRWFLIMLYKVRKKELTKEVEEKIVSRALMVLMALILVVTVLDVARFF